MPRISRIEILQTREQPILFIRTKTKINLLTQLIGESFRKMQFYLQEIGEYLSDVPFVGYYNLDMQNLDVEMGFPVSKALPAKDDIKSKTMTAEKVVFCMYRGAYDKLEPVYDEMAAWIEKNGYQPKAVSYEYYYNDKEFPENELLTKIVMPLQ